MDCLKLFEELKRNTIELRFETAKSALPKGASKFGGKPELPEGFQWSYFTTDTFDDDEVKPRPLAFLAQMNCAGDDVRGRHSLVLPTQACYQWPCCHEVMKCYLVSLRSYGNAM